jgi:hypothetical protein
MVYGIVALHVSGWPNGPMWLRQAIFQARASADSDRVLGIESVCGATLLAKLALSNQVAISSRCGVQTWFP